MEKLEPAVEPQGEDSNCKQGDTDEELYIQVWNGRTR